MYVFFLQICLLIFFHSFKLSVIQIGTMWCLVVPPTSSVVAANHVWNFAVVQKKKKGVGGQRLTEEGEAGTEGGEGPGC